MEKYDLLVLALDKHSSLLEPAGCVFARLKNQYALNHATLVLIFLGKTATRIIAGQQIGEIGALPPFNDTDGSADAILAIQSWIYEAQANMYSGSTAKMRTAVFVDASGDVLEAHRIKPADVLGNLEETDYYRKAGDGEADAYEQVVVSPVARLEALAKAGDEKALYELGLAYINGEGVEKNSPKGQMMLHKAYLRGNIDAIYALVDLSEEPSEYYIREAAKHERRRNNHAKSL